MRRIISFMHISLDGFVAGPNGEMDWITINEEIFSHVEKRIGTGDTALYGRVTFQMMEAYWPTAADKPDASHHDRVHSKWYKGIRKLVLSNTLSSDASSNSVVISHNLTERISEIKQEEGPDILLFGSPTATHSLIEKDLIDGYWLFLNPILLGDGIPLFNKVQQRRKLKTIKGSVQFDCGVTELNYLVDRS